MKATDFPRTERGMGNSGQPRIPRECFMPCLRGLYVVGILLLLSCLTLQTGCGKKKDKGGDTTRAVPQPTAFKLEAMPDKAYALGNAWKEQKYGDPAEVLKDWKTKYTAPSDVDDKTKVKWFVNDKNIGMGESVEETKGQLGNFNIKMTATKGGQPVDFTRLLIVGDVQSDSFDLTPDGQWIKDQTIIHWVVPPIVQKPLKRGLIMTGRVSKTGQSPSLAKFKWGFIQSVEWSTDARYYPIAHQKTPGTPGTYVVPDPPEYWYVANIPANTNDSELGHQLYSNSQPGGLGQDPPKLVFDSPGAPYGSSASKQTDNAGNPITLLYQIVTPNTMKAKFMVWQVVLHSETEQYVPLKQRGWRLEWDTNQPGPWPAIVDPPAAQLTQPSDKSTSSIPYLRPKNGPPKKYPFK